MVKETEKKLREEQEIIDFLIERYRENLESYVDTGNPLAIPILDTELKYFGNHLIYKRLNDLKEKGFIKDFTDHDDGSGYDHETHEVTAFTVFLPQDIENKIRIREKSKARKTQIVVASNFIFFFNQSSGELSLYPREKNNTCSFIPKDGRYKIMIALIEEKEKDEDYTLTSKLTSDGGYKNSRGCIKAIHAMRETIKKTFPKVRGIEFIEGEQPHGYRISKKFEVRLEGTP